MTTALIAEDESLLAETLRDSLANVWPALEIIGLAHDGEAALAAIDQYRPDVVFLDIRMPRKSGLEVAQALALGLPVAGGYAQPYVPLIVFVTAYDQYAIDAFESVAADYLLKPVSEERLARCTARVKDRLQARDLARSQAADLARDPARLQSGVAGAESGEASLTVAADVLAAMAGGLPALQQLMQALAGQLSGQGGASNRLRFIRASLGDVIRQIPVEAVLYLEAQDKYVAVVTRDATALVRAPLSELLAALDPDRFVQIHRSTVVRVDAIDTIRRDLTGRQFVHLRELAGGRAVKLPVSRQYSAQFRGL